MKNFFYFFFLFVLSHHRIAHQLYHLSIIPLEFSCMVTLTLRNKRQKKKKKKVVEVQWKDYQHDFLCNNFSHHSNTVIDYKR